MPVLTDVIGYDKIICVKSVYVKIIGINSDLLGVRPYSKMKHEFGYYSSSISSFINNKRAIWPLTMLYKNTKVQ